MYLMKENFDLNRLLKLSCVKSQITDMCDPFESHFIEILNHDDLLKLLRFLDYLTTNCLGPVRLRSVLVLISISTLSSRA